MSLIARLWRRSLITAVGLVVAASFVAFNTEITGVPNPGVLEPNIVPFSSDDPLLESPNLCVGGEDRARTIRWNHGTLAQVWVSVDGAEEVFLACGASGDQDAPLIQPDHTYVFRLYEASSCNPSDRGDVPVAGVPVTFPAPTLSPIP